MRTLALAGLMLLLALPGCHLLIAHEVSPAGPEARVDAPSADLSTRDRSLARDAGAEARLDAPADRGPPQADRGKADGGKPDGGKADGGKPDGKGADNSAKKDSAGPSTAYCVQLANLYAVNVSLAKSCKVNTDCSTLVDHDLRCPCETYVDGASSYYSALASYASTWSSSGCSALNWNCTEANCVTPTPACVGGRCEGP